MQGLPVFKIKTAWKGLNFFKKRNYFELLNLQTVVMPKRNNMEIQFYIEMRMKTGKGWERFAMYFIGNDRGHAHAVFNQLKGMEVSEKNVLHIDFVETVEGLPVNIKILTCTLNQLADNCKFITKELFKLKNLGVL